MMRNKVRESLFDVVASFNYALSEDRHSRGEQSEKRLTGAVARGISRARQLGERGRRMRLGWLVLGIGVLAGGAVAFRFFAEGLGEVPVLGGGEGDRKDEQAA